MRRLLLIAALTAGQAFAVDDPEALLREVRKKVLATVTKLPRYLCTETIDRAIRKPAGSAAGVSCDDLAGLKKKGAERIREIVSDRLRLDVAVSADDEMYSWAGADRFGDRSLADLVGNGATSTGAFATFLASIFGTGSAHFTYNGDIDASTGEFGFVVPLEKSNYTVGNKLHQAIVKYHGTFRVDTKTFDLLRLTIHADELPKEIGACDDSTTLEYQHLQINSADFLLPKSARLLVSNIDGSELDNQTTFSGCHEFHGESTLNFDVPSEPQSAQAAGKTDAPQTIPPGIPFTITLTQSIDTATAAAGDLVKARLTGAIRSKQKEVLVPKNAPVLGRIVELEKFYGNAGSGVQALRVGIQLESVEINGSRRDFEAQLDSVEQGSVLVVGSGLGGMRGMRSADRIKAREDIGSWQEMLSSYSKTAGYLVFDDVTKDFVIRAGLDVEGKTRERK